MEKVNDKIYNYIKNNELKIEEIMEKYNSYIYTIINHFSIDFSKEIEKIALNYNSQITFIIGGTLGLTDQILKLSNDKLCFSKMTFPHQLIRIFLVEQLFRAFKFSNNETYHW